VTGRVGILVNNFTSDTLRVYWWWYNAPHDSAIILPSTTAQCFHFTATAWAQIAGDLFYNRSVAGYFTPAFDPAAGITSLPFTWEVDATFQAPPDDVTIVWNPNAAC